MNDPAFAPINGISLQRYAELGAAVEGKENDPAAVKQIVEGEGVRYEDYEAAKQGWTARMQDMSLMGRVATEFMPLYQAALAKKKGGAARISYQDFVHGSAAIKAYGFQAAIPALGISQADWTEAAGHWNAEMGKNMMQYAGHHPAVAQEEAQIRAAGRPRQIQVERVAGAATPTAEDYGGGAYGGGMQGAMAQAMNNPAVAQQQQAAASVAANPLGFGLGQVANMVTGGITAGSQVKVSWSDGNAYPGQVLQAAPGQYLVQFTNGAQQWIPENSIAKA